MVGPWWDYRCEWGTCIVDDYEVVHYSGKVVARLKDQRGERMRCVFSLDEPMRGSSGGGSGSCSISDGEKIAAATLEPE